jgi:hypothetical protein
MSGFKGGGQKYFLFTSTVDELRIKRFKHSSVQLQIHRTWKCRFTKANIYWDLHLVQVAVNQFN